MWFSLLRELRRRVKRPSRPCVRPGSRRLPLEVQVLEDRLAPATLTVTTLADSGAGSLRAQIGAAANGDTINFQAGLSSPITLTSGELQLNKNLTIAGPGAGTLSVSGNHASRIFEVISGVTATISGLTLTTGSGGTGGGVLIDGGGTLTLTGCTLSGNSAGDGGGIYNSGTLTLASSTLSGNSANGPFGIGGGIDNHGTLTATSSTLSGNSANGQYGTAGGISNFSGTLTVTSSTLSGNSAQLGGGLYVFTGSPTLRNTIVAGNTAGGPSDIAGQTVNANSSYNLIGTGGSGGLSNGVNHNQVGDANPGLGTLADNGGPTLTLNPLAGSPAIGTGDPALTTGTDQRGVNRTAPTGIGAVDPLLVTNLSDHDVRSLRAEIARSINGVTINFAPGLSGIIFLTTGELELHRNVTITGPGAGTLSVSGNNATRVFEVFGAATDTLSSLTLTAGRVGTDNGGGVLIDSGGTLTLTGCTVRDNATITQYGSGSGGGIYNAGGGTLTVTSSTLSVNSAQYGGGIYNGGTLTVTSSTLTYNGARVQGAGIFNHGTLTMTSSTLSVNNGFVGGDLYNDGTLTVTSSTLSGSNAPYGGGIYNGGTLTVTSSTLSGNSGQYGGGIYNGGTLTVTSSTLSGNSGTYGGGIYYNGGMLTLTNSTLSGNSAFQGGGIYDAGSRLTMTSNTLSGNSAQYGGGIYTIGSPTLRNTIVAGNVGVGISDDISGTVNAGSSYNLIGTGGAGGLSNGVNHNQVGVANPGLGTLADHGGSTLTMTLLAGSPALDAGDPTQLGVADQRGVLRSGGVNIGAYQASASAFVLTAPATVRADAPFNVTVTGRDPYGNTALGYTGTVHVTSSDAQAALPANYTFAAADNGVHTFRVILRTLGTQSITATDTAVPSLTATQAGIQVTPNPPKQIQVTGFPSPILAGAAGNMTVAITDSDGNIITSYRGTVHFTSSDGQAVLPSVYTFTAADAGVHTFRVTLKTAGTQSITATDSAMATLTGTQTGIVVTPGAASTLSVFFPSAITAGAAGTLTLTARDAYGNTATGYRGTVRFTSSDPHPAILPANYTFTAGDNGVHTFTGGATLFTAGSQSITATDTATASITGSASATVTAAATAHLLVTTSASSVVAGTPIDVTVTAQDAYGNTTAGYRGTVHFSSSDPHPATLPANYTFTGSDNGTHKFTGGATLFTAGSRSITATDTVTASITGSASLMVTAGAATHFLVTTSAATVTQGMPFDVTLTAQDAYGNTATGYRGTVTFSSTDPQALLPTHYTFTTGTGGDNGTHKFVGGATLFTAGSQSVTATDTVVAGITGSASVTVMAVLDHFQVTTSVDDSGTVAGTPFDVTVTAVDAAGNVLTSYTGTITFASADPYGATLPDDYTFQPGDQGQVTFPGGATLYTAGTWDVTVTDTATAASGSAALTVTAAPAVAFQLLAPASAPSGQAFDLTVIAVDPYGNTDTNYQGTVTFTSTDSDPGVILPADYTFQAGDQGMVTLAGGVTLITAGDQVVTATDTADATISGSATVTVSSAGPGVGRQRPSRSIPASLAAARADRLFAELASLGSANPDRRAAARRWELDWLWQQDW